MNVALFCCIVLTAAQHAAGMATTAGECEGRPLIGAIRWDAWHGDASEVGLLVEKTLGPKHWHHRLPFYGQVVGENAVEARANDQTIMDQEIEYAHAAGLDYWAFVTYPEKDALSLGLKLYLSSEKKNKVNFCLNLQGGWESQGGSAAWPGKVDRYVRHFRESAYQTVLQGRPLVFLYSIEDLVGPGRFETWADARQAVDALRAAAKAAGLPSPYIVAQGWSPETLREQTEVLGLDAVGAYAAAAGAKAGSYADLAAHAESRWDALRATGKPVVPLASAGWDMRPRVETPVPWVEKGDIEEYYAAPTPAELTAHVGRALAWCRNHPEAAEARTVLIYAWNEFDEGGWLCPTLGEGDARVRAIREAAAAFAASTATSGS